MRELKASPEGAVTLAVLSAMGRAPQTVENWVIRLFEKKATLVATNVPGPREPRFLAGQRIDSLVFFAPQAGRLGLGLSIFSYAHQIWFSIRSDEGLVGDPDHLVVLILDELDVLRRSER